MLSLEYLVWDSVTLEEHGSCRQESKISRCFISRFLPSGSLPMRSKKSVAGLGRRSEHPGAAPAGLRGGRAHIFPSPAAGAPQGAAARSTPASLARGQPEAPEAVLSFGAKGRGREAGVGGGWRGAVQRKGAGERGGLDLFRVPPPRTGTLRPSQYAFLPAQKPRLPYQSIPCSPKISLPASKNTSQIP